MKNSMSEKPRIIFGRGVHEASCLIASVSCGVQHLLGTAAQCIAVNTIQIVFHSLFSPFRFTVLRGRAVRLCSLGLGSPAMLHGVFPIEEIRPSRMPNFFCPVRRRPRCPSCAEPPAGSVPQPAHLIRPRGGSGRCAARRIPYPVYDFQLRPYPLGNLYRA